MNTSRMPLGAMFLFWIPALTRLASPISADAQAAPASGVYRITSGVYTECCGFGGNEFAYSLPDERQSYVRFFVNPSNSLATLAFLSEDARTVFQTFPCGSIPGPRPVTFQFADGRAQSGTTVFSGSIFGARVDYTVRHGPEVIEVAGTVDLLVPVCLDAPSHFAHRGIAATLLPGPRLTVLDRSPEGLTRIMVQGQVGWTDVIESSTNMVHWRPVSTNFMNNTDCVICPFAVFEDPESKSGGNRFYRAAEYR